MSDERRRLDEYIKATDQRVENWSNAQRDAFREATCSQNSNSESQPVTEPKRD